jgi:hypothetical protein
LNSVVSRAGRSVDLIVRTVKRSINVKALTPMEERQMGQGRNL